MLTLLLGCIVLTREDLAAQTDADLDGIPASEDCNDQDALVSPAVQETCNGRDDDCSGAIDDGLLPDDDGDGFGDDAHTGEACFSDWVTTGGDCDDSDPLVFPGQIELCNGQSDGCQDDWSPEDELGTVTLHDEGGLTDLSSEFSAGSPQEPATIELPSTGTVHICRGAADWDVFLRAESPEALHLVGRPIPLDGDEEERDAAPVLSGRGQGSVIVVEGGEQMSVSGLTITGGFAVQGGGLHISGMERFAIAESTIRGNQVSHDENLAGGGGMLLEGVQAARILTTTFEDNTANDDLYGGGLAIDGGSEVEVDGCTFHGNHSQLAGGAVEVYSGRLTVYGSTFTDNSARFTGGAIQVETGSALNIYDSVLSENEAEAGGALSLNGNAEQALRVDFIDNTATTDGAVARVSEGGGINGQEVTIEGSVVTEGHCAGDAVGYPDVSVLVEADDHCDHTDFYTITDPSCFRCNVQACYKGAEAAQ